MWKYLYEGNTKSSHRQRTPVYWLNVLLILSSLVLTTLSFAPLSRTTKAANAAAIWYLVWNDEFNGAAGTGVTKANWLYDTGTGYGCVGCPSNWGTGEVETMTRSTANVYQDGAGYLKIKPIRDAKGNWTSGRIETQRTNFAAPLHGQLAVEASIQQPNITGQTALGYWPALRAHRTTSCCRCQRRRTLRSQWHCIVEFQHSAMLIAPPIRF